MRLNYFGPSKYLNNYYMLIMCQKSRSHMLGHYTREMWGLIYLHAMRTVLENHRVWVVSPNSGHSLVSQDNECWEVNKGLQTHRIQNTVFTLTVKIEPFCFWDRIPWSDPIRPVRPDDVCILHLPHWF